MAIVWPSRYPAARTPSPCSRPCCCSLNVRPSIFPYAHSQWSRASSCGRSSRSGNTSNSAVSTGPIITAGWSNLATCRPAFVAQTIVFCGLPAAWQPKPQAAACRFNPIASFGPLAVDGAALERGDSRLPRCDVSLILMAARIGASEFFVNAEGFAVPFEPFPPPVGFAQDQTDVPVGVGDVSLRLQILRVPI